MRVIPGEVNVKATTGEKNVRDITDKGNNI